MENNYKQYIDNNSYKRMLDNVSIPEKWIDLLVEVHKNSVKYDAIDEIQMENKPKQDTLYIFIEEKNNDLLIKILSFLLKNKIYILYNNIYFTNSKRLLLKLKGVLILRLLIIILLLIMMHLLCLINKRLDD